MKRIQSEGRDIILPVPLDLVDSESSSSTGLSKNVTSNVELALL